MNDSLLLGHPVELVKRAVALPNGHFVQLDDLVFVQHGLGPRYARVQTQMFRGRRGHAELSYAYLDFPEATYQLITDIDAPVDLGPYEDLLAYDVALTKRLSETFNHRLQVIPTPQQLGLALIHAKAGKLRAEDELGAHRVCKWAVLYERRAHWIACNRQLASEKPAIQWDALGL